MAVDHSMKRAGLQLLKAKRLLSMDLVRSDAAVPGFMLFSGPF